MKKGLLLFVEENPGKAIFAGTLLAFSFFLLFFSPQYQTNDDVRQCMIASGVSLTQAPDAHILFPHIYLGEILSRMYGTFPSVPWYGLMLYAALFWGFVFWGLALFRMKRDTQSWLKAGLLFLLVMVPMMQFIQYTMAACWLISGAWFLLVRSKSKWEVIATALAIILGSMIRWESFLLVALLAIPLHFIDFGEKSWKQRTFQLLAILSVCFLLFWANSAAYSGNELWEDFYPDNSIRSKVIDYEATPYSDENKVIFEEIGWDESAYNLYKSWFIADRDFHSIPKLKSLLFKAQPQSISDRNITHQLKYNVLALLLMIPILLLLPFLSVNRKAKKVLWALGLMAFAILIYMVFFKWLQPRITHAVLGIVLAAMLIQVRFPEKVSFQWSHFPISLLIAGAILSTTGYGFRNYRAAERAKIFEKVITSLPPNSDPLFAVWSDSFPFELLVRPFEENRKITQHLDLLELGLTAYTPFHEEMKARHGIANIHEGLTSPNVMLIARPEFLPIYTAFMKAHYDRKVEFEPILEKKEIGLWIWKVK